MALSSNDINDLNRKRIIESTDVSGQPGIVVLNADGSAVGAPVGGATSANQTNGSQKTQIVDAGGEVATVTGGKLDVNATASLAGEAIPISGATTAVGVAIVDGSGNQITSFGGGTQYTEGDTDASITGTVSMMEVAANTLQPIQGTVADGLLVNLGANNDVTVSGVATAANQTTMIGHVDGIEGLLTTIDADTGNIATEVAGLLTDTELRATPVPVSGTVTANLSATDNAVLDAIEADTTTIAGAVSGTEMQVDVLTMPTVTVTATNLDVQSGGADLATSTQAGAIQTSVELIDDTVKVLGTDTYTEATSKGLTISAVRRDADTTLVNTTNEFTPLQVDANGRLKVEAFSGETLPVSLTSTTVTLTAGAAAVGSILPPDTDVTAHTNYARKYYTNTGAVTDGIVWSPAAGKRWHVVTMYIQTSAAATITLEDDKAGGDDPVWKGEIAANSGVTLSFTEHYPMASGEDAADLIITTSAGNVFVTCVGYEI